MVSWEEMGTVIFFPQNAALQNQTKIFKSLLKFLFSSKFVWMS